jgi:hypothetical protein
MMRWAAFAPADERISTAQGPQKHHRLHAIPMPDDALNRSDAHR